mgnify:CR=1 FL=1
MRNWPLRWKVALYSASLAVAATLGGAITTWFVMRHAEIAAFDRRLTTDARGVLSGRGTFRRWSDEQRAGVPRRSSCRSHCVSTWLK